MQLATSVAMFATAALVYVIPDWSVGIVIFAIAVAQLRYVYASNDWALVDTGLVLLLGILGVMTLIAPEWGIPLLLITAGVQLIRAFGDVGMIIVLLLVAWLAFSRGTPIWAVATLVLVAGGKLLFLVREHLGDGSGTWSAPT